MVVAMGACEGKVDLRPAGIADARAIAQVRVQTWQVAYRDMLPAQFLDELSVETSERRFREVLSSPTRDRRTWVAHSDGQVVGFVSLGAVRDEPPPPGSGEVYAIYVLPDCWDRGVGRLLLDTAARELTTLGYGSALLWVLADNQRARAFYERAGWQADGATKQATFGGRAVTEVRYWTSLDRAGRAG
jgi:ribosomal protein S18 acetylase RimI-like enzyme